MNTAIPARTLRALRILSIAYLVQATGALSVAGSMAPISREWSLTDAQTAYLISVFGVTFALTAPLLQVYLGHLRRRLQVLIGLAVFSSASLLFAAAPNYPILLISRVLMGFGAGFIGPVLGALGSGLVRREEQGSAIAIVLLGLSVAGMVGIPVSAWLSDAYGARTLFLAVGLAGATTAALVVFFVPDQSEGERVQLSTLVALVTRAQSLSAFLVAFFVAAAVYATYTFISPIIREVYHGSAGIVSTALTILGVAGVAGNLFVTRAARRYGAVQMLVAGMIILVIDMFIFWWTSPNLAWLCGTLLVWAFGTDILWPSQQRRIIELAPHLRGIALAVTASFVFCGIGFGSAVAGWVYPSYGLGGVLSSSVFFILMAAASLRVSCRQPVSAGESVTI